MELINLERVLPPYLLKEIDKICKSLAKDEQYKVIYGQLFIGKETMADRLVADVIKNMICDFFKVSKPIILSKTRKQPYMRYRQVIAYMVRRYTNLTLGEIGQFMDHAHHSTIINSIESIKQWIISDQSFREQMGQLDERLQSILIEKDQ